MVGRTTVVVAHRLSTVMNVDTVLGGIFKIRLATPILYGTPTAKCTCTLSDGYHAYT